MKRIFFSVILLICTACGTSWTEEEKSLINDGGSVMRVLTVEDAGDLSFLRRSSAELTCRDIRSEEYRLLEKKMIETVTSPEQDGVGIAGPQVGISRRIVAVQRFDKTGNPFEVYPNIRVIGQRGECVAGPEGCLSVPGRHGTVMRPQDISISYTSPATMKDTTETVRGFTAVIFQHEADHLDGVLYIDKLSE